MHATRRQFIIGAGAVSAAFGLLGTPRLARSEQPASSLRPDPNGLLDLPEGFSYSVISRTGDALTDGFSTPSRPDGMASFALGKGRHILLRNHENGAEHGGESGFPAGAGQTHGSLVYDHADDGSPLPGGVTGLVWNLREQRVEESWLALAGTLVNCSGGPTPWGSWISCEETMVRAGEDAGRDHGYNFEIPVQGRSLVAPNPLRAMGRFRHEGVAVDPRSGAVYQTEDRKDGLFYRFLPHVPGDLAKGGRLQALVIKGEPQRDTRNWPSLVPMLESPRFPARKAVAVEWIDVDGVDNPDDDLRRRGRAKGAAIFARGEGVWYGRGEVFFACTIGGQAESGQIWRYRPSPREGQPDEGHVPPTLTLWSEPGDAEVIDRCDNITVHPSGALVITEDGKGENFLRILTRDGRWKHLARNAHPIGGEMCGVCFTPDGRTMFVNIQVPGITLAVTGPLDRLI